MYFSNKPQFYEVSTSKAAWVIQNITYELKKDADGFKDFTSQFMQISESPNVSISSPKRITKQPSLLTSPSSSTDFGPRSVRSSLETCNGIAQSTERLIREQSEMLKRLERQIKDLQTHVISNNSESPKKTKDSSKQSSPKMVNSATNTTLFSESKPNSPNIFDTKKAASTNTSFITSASERKLLPPRNPRTSTLKITSEESLEFIKYSKQMPSRTPSMRYSMPSDSLTDLPSHHNSISTSFNKISNTDTTIPIPKIIYESSSDTSEDENLSAVEKKYIR